MSHKPVVQVTNIWEELPNNNFVNKSLALMVFSIAFCHIGNGGPLDINEGTICKFIKPQRRHHMQIQKTTKFVKDMPPPLFPKYSKASCKA